MSSTRLPGKVLMTALDRPLLELMIERVRRARYIDDVIVATTTNAADTPIIDLCARLGVRYHRGSEEDVLGRLYETHRLNGTTIVVELTGDCPLIDPIFIDHCILEFVNGDFDYVASDPTPATYPESIGVQVFSFETLEWLHCHALTPEDREHVTAHVHRYSERYRRKFLNAKAAHRAPDLTITLDTEPDFKRIRKVFERLYPENPNFGLDEIIRFLRANA